MYGRIIRDYVEGGTRQKDYVYSHNLLRMPVHEERARNFQFVNKQTI